MTQFDITAIGILAGQIQTPVRQLSDVAEHLGIVPTAHINGIPHYSRQDVERIAARIRATTPAAPIAPIADRSGIQ